MNEILVAASRLKPINRAAVMVTPEREAPGISARTCVVPIIVAEKKFGVLTIFSLNHLSILIF